MKSYSKGILVGISIVLGSLLLMGYTSSETEVGRYQIISSTIIPMNQDGSYGTREETITLGNEKMASLNFTFLIW